MSLLVSTWLVGCRSSFNPLSFTAIKLAFTASLLGFQNWFIFLSFFAGYCAVFSICIAILHGNFG
jgi:hypothetical protein